MGELSLRGNYIEGQRRNSVWGELYRGTGEELSLGGNYIEVEWRNSVWGELYRGTVEELSRGAELYRGTGEELSLGGNSIEVQGRDGQSPPIWSRLQFYPQSFEAPAPALSGKNRA